jgi:hypothetical protein
MALPPEIARSVPYVVAQQLGELMVRIEKLEQRVHCQGQSLKRLVDENRLLSAKLARQTRPSAERPPPPAPRASPPVAVEPTRPPEATPDFTASLRELQRTGRRTS